MALGDTVNLNGSESTDANADSLTYAWSISTKPPGSAAAIANPADVQTSFVPDLWATYVVQLVVNDGFVNSDPSKVAIQVTLTPNSVIRAIQTSLQPLIASLNPKVFKNANMQKNHAE